MSIVSYWQWQEICRGLIDNSPPVPTKEIVIWESNGQTIYWLSCWRRDEYLPFAIYWRDQVHTLLNMPTFLMIGDIWAALDLYNQYLWQSHKGVYRYLKDLEVMDSVAYKWNARFGYDGIDAQIKDMQADPDRIWIGYYDPTAWDFYGVDQQDLNMVVIHRSYPIGFHHWARDELVGFMDIPQLFAALNTYLWENPVWWHINPTGETAIKRKHDTWDHATGGGNWPFMLDDIDKDRDEISERTTETFIDLADRALKSSRP